MLQALAEKYAQTLGATVLTSKEHDGQITFVLSTGPKYTKTEKELIQALDESQGITTKPAPPAVTEDESQEPRRTQPADDDKPKRKARTK
jgi:hypothetical protein